MLKPYAGAHPAAEQRIFNTRLSRQRQVVERTFGLLKGRWRRLFAADSALRNVPTMVDAAIVLHNWCTRRDEVELPADADAKEHAVVDQGAAVDDSDDELQPEPDSDEDEERKDDAASAAVKISAAKSKKLRAAAAKAARDRAMNALVGDD